MTHRQPDGTEIVERLPNTETLAGRLVTFEQNLEADRWRRNAVRMNGTHGALGFGRAGAVTEAARRNGLTKARGSANTCGR